MASSLRLIYLSSALRAIAISLSSVLLPLHLAHLKFSSAFIAIIISMGLFGCACGTFTASFFSDHLGRRKTLLGLAFLMTLGGTLFVFTSHAGVIFLAAFLGMMNGMGRDRGMGLTIEQAMLAQIVAPGNRTKVFAWYNVFVDLGNAFGALLAFLPSLLRSKYYFSILTSYQWIWAFYALLCFVSGLLVLFLDHQVELKGSSPIRKLSKESKPLVMKFAFLSGMDSFGGGFLSTSLLSFWFFKRFGVDESFLGPLFFVARLANGLSHLGAAWLAKKIGLVKTMVFTHLPSSLILMTVPFMPNLPVASLLFLLRECLVEMDVPTRQSYIHAIVKNEERTRASGIANLARSVAWSLGPLMAAPLMKTLALSAPIYAGAFIKVIYDVSLYRSFQHLKPPEEAKPTIREFRN